MNQNYNSYEIQLNNERKQSASKMMVPEKAMSEQNFLSSRPKFNNNTSVRENESDRYDPYKNWENDQSSEQIHQ